MTEEPAAALAPSATSVAIAGAPRGFLKGAFVGLAIWCPLLTATLWLAARWDIRHRSDPLLREFLTALVFAGVPTLLTAGSLGRSAARLHSRALSHVAAAAIAGAGLAVLAAVPNGGVLDTERAWLALAAIGATASAPIGWLLWRWAVPKSRARE